MNAADLPLHRVSPANQTAVHYYFHQSPESPDGTRVIYTVLPDAPPDIAFSKEWVKNQPAQVWIANRDGSNRKLVGEVQSALTHVGACAIWLDDQTVAFRDRSDFSVHVVSLNGGADKKWVGDISDFSPARRELLFYAEAKPTTKETKMKKGELLYSDDFRTLDNWRVEAANPSEVRAQAGALEVDSSAGVTAWFATPLRGDVLIEYEATVIKNGGPNDRVSDLNCFWMASDPQAPDDFWQRGDWRGGDFKNYQSLQLYYVGYGGHDNTKTRFRRYNGQPNPPIAAEWSDAAQLIRPNHTYKIQLVRQGNSAQFWRDGEKLFDFSDEAPLQSGYFGFRTVRNHVRFANFRVYRLEAGAAK